MAKSQFQAYCSTCHQSSLLQGKTGASNWARAHRQLCARTVRVIKVKAHIAMPKAAMRQSGGGK